MTRDEVKRIMAAVQVLWPHSPLYPNGHASLAVDVWHQMIGDLDKTATLACVQSLAADGREHAPPVGTIRARTVETVAELTGDAIPSLGAAIGEIRREIGRVGREGDPRFSHPAIAQAVNSMGWRTFCNSTNSDVTDAMFRRCYEPVAVHAAREQSLPPGAQLALGKVAFKSIEEATG